MNAPAPKASLAATIEAALVELDRSVHLADLQHDPLRHPIKALACFLRAQQALQEEHTATVTATWPPIPMPEVRRAVTRGVADHASYLVKAIKLGTAAAIAGMLLIALLTGFGGGYWYKYSTTVIPEPAPALECIANRGGSYCGYWQALPTEPEPAAIPLPTPTHRSVR